MKIHALTKSRGGSQKAATSALLLPEIERQDAEGKEVAFRVEAAFAKPEIYDLMLAEGHLHRRLFGQMLQRIWALPAPSG